MNRIHQVVWSELRKSFIVVGENAKAKGKPSSTTGKAVASAVMAALAALTAEPALAVGSSCPAASISISGSETATCNLADGNALTVNSGGSIVVAATAVVMGNTVTTGSIANSGTITGTPYGIYLDHSTVTANITNNTGGTISASSGNYGIFLLSSIMTGGVTNSVGGTISSVSNGMYFGHSTMSGIINNSGTIIGTSAGGGGIHLNAVLAFDPLLGSTIGGINNSGTIIAGSSGINIASHSTVTGSITNSGTISGTKYTGLYLATSAVHGGITNSGTISGGVAGMHFDYWSAPGISTVDGGIINSGLIAATDTASPYYERAIYLRSAIVNGGINNSGTISASAAVAGEGIYLKANSIVNGGITNSGTISAGNAGIHLLSNSTVTGGITNSGTISTGGFGISVDNSSVIGDITNNASGTFSNASNSINVTKSSVTGNIINIAGGTITSQNHAIIFHGSTMSGDFINGGTVYGLGRGFELNAVTGLPNTGSTIGSIVNTGRIQGGSSGINIATNSAVTGGITNSGTISGGTGSGIYVAGFPGGPTNLAVHSTISGGIVNNGTISGGSGGIVLSWASVLSGGIHNTGTIQGGSSAGIYVGRHSSFSGGIINSGTITGGSPGGIRVRINTTLGGGITNSGTIQANNNGAGISVTQSAVVGMVANSGTISGDTYAINVDGSSTLSNIDITGTTARFIGDVFSQSTDVAIKAGAIFANDNAFDVKSFTIENGATFNMGAGPNIGVASAGVTVTNGFTNAGTLSVAAGTTATITGNYTQDAAGIFQTSASSTTNYGQLAVTGIATLPTLTKIDVNVNGTNLFGTGGGKLAGVISAGTLTSDGTFSVTDNSYLVDFVGVKNGNAVDLAVVTQASAQILKSVQILGNQPAYGSATVLDNLLALSISNGSTGDVGMDAVLNRLVTYGSQQQVSEAVSQTLPLMTGGMSQAMGNALHSTNRIIQSRQEGQHGRSSGDEFFGDQHAWFKPFGSWANQDNRKGVPGYDANTYGMVFGADAEVSDTNRLGIAFAYAHSNVDSNSNVARQSADVNSYQLAVYGSHNLSDTTDINFQVDIGQHDNKGMRDITFAGTRAKSDYTSWSGHVGAGLSHTYTISDKTSLTPSIRADYTRVRDENYNENGAGALNLRVNSNTTEELVFGVDGKLAHALTDKATLTANLGLGYDVINEQASITSAFAGAPTSSFTTKGMDPSPWLMRGGLGIVGKATETVEVSARYDVEARKDFDNQTASVKVRWSF